MRWRRAAHLFDSSAWRVRIVAAKTFDPFLQKADILTRREKIKLSDYLPYLVNRLGSALVLRFSEDALARHGLSIATWRVLVALSDNGPQRQIDLSEITSIDVSTLSRLVTRLVQQALATRTRSNRSNREVVVALTARGEKLVDELIPIARRLERAAISGLSPTELRSTRTVLRVMYQNLARPKLQAKSKSKR
jgi:DNA-binding MarR family transcriptional regulator